MEISHIRSFIAAAESQSISKAAKLLHSTQSTISRQIATLERDVATLLFHREGRGIRLTAAGQAFLVEAYNLLQQVDRTMEALESAATDKPRLRIGYTAPLMYAFINDALLEFCKTRPDVLIELVEKPASGQLSLIEHKALDLACVGGSQPRAPHLTVQKLARSPLILAVPEGYRLNTSGEAMLLDYRDQLFLIPSNACMPGYENKLRNVCRVAGFQPKMRENDSLSSILAGVSMALGISVLPAEVTLLPHAGVQFRTIHFPRPESEISVVTSGRSYPEHVGIFIELLRKTASSRFARTFWMEGVSSQNIWSDSESVPDRRSGDRRSADRRSRQAAKA